MSSIITQAKIKHTFQCNAINEKYNCQCKFPEGHQGDHEFTIIWEQEVSLSQTIKKKVRKN